MPRWVVAVAGIVYLLLHLPVMVLVVFSFNNSKFSVDWQGFTLQWYRRLLERPDILHGLKVSLAVGAAATIIAVLLGTMIALALARHRFRGRHAFEGFLYVPVVTPEVVAGISLLILFARLEIPLGVTTITIAHVAFCISFVVIVVMARLEGMDQNLEEAAMVLGADELTTFRRVTLPHLWPGILAAGLLAFTISFDDFVITSFVSGPGSSTLPIVVYGMVRRNVEPSINAVSTIILLVTAGLIYGADWLLRRGPAPAARRLRGRQG